MPSFRRKLPPAALLAAAVLLALPGSGAAAERTRTIAPSARQGNTAVFKPPRAIAADVVAGELVAGGSRQRLRAGQLRALAHRGVLRVRVPRRSTRIRLSLQLQPAADGAAAGADDAVGGGGGAEIAVGPAIAADPPGADPSFDPLSGGRLYSPTSPFNRPIPPSPAIDANSAQMTQSLVRAQGQKGFVLTVDEWTVPVYFADSGTPLRSVSLGGGPPEWGLAESYPPYPPGSSEGGLPREMPERLQGMPIPAGARPDPSLDAHMTVLDPAANCEYDLYGAYQTSDGWRATWANSTRLDGSGVYPRGMGTKAAGFASLAGLIWPQELRAGHIDHALFFAYPFSKSGGPVSPATAGDGSSDEPGAIPEGARVQLDPDLDLDSLGLRPYQRTIAEAMQTYGMILGDTGGAFGLYAVGRAGFDGNPYQGLLPDEDFPDLGQIPANRFRVLELPAQQPRPPQQLVPSGCGSFG
ncbi:MAG TPA: hypothetical protein VGO36_01310 [Solirubrobacterales bacterium]|jgi:hypothetical protein|nr:hypothetical protein [Solirubrobacterales bacterium]